MGRGLLVGYSGGKELSIWDDSVLWGGCIMLRCTCIDFPHLPHVCVVTSRQSHVTCTALCNVQSDGTYSYRRALFWEHVSSVLFPECQCAVPQNPDGCAPSTVSCKHTPVGAQC